MISPPSHPREQADVRHLWGVASHSLCELVHGDDDAEARDALRVDAPVCGPCILIAGRLRRQACALLELSGGEVAPSSPRDSWELLTATPWTERMDVHGFLRANPRLDERTRYDAIGHEVDQASVNALVDEMYALQGRNAGAS